MKKLLVAFLTFAIGIVTFNLVKTRETSTLATLTMENKAVVASQSSLGNIPSERIKYSTPFFDSFTSNEYDRDKYQGYGGWFMADEFKGMPEVWTILLYRDLENSKNGKFVWSATILFRDTDYNAIDADDFHSVWIKTESNHLNFKTNKYHGTEYKFEGEFFKNGKDFSQEEKVLKGTMQKIVKGKVIAKFTADFAYYEPRCFH